MLSQKAVASVEHVIMAGLFRPLSLEFAYYVIVRHRDGGSVHWVGALSVLSFCLEHVLAFVVTHIIICYDCGQLFLASCGR